MTSDLLKSYLLIAFVLLFVRNSGLNPIITQSLVLLVTRTTDRSIDLID